MKTKLKMALSLILSLIVIFSSIAIGGMFANADTSTGKAIQLVKDGAAANISGGQASNIYFGNYAQSDKTGKAKDPIKWRVLANNTSSKQLFLLSDQGLDTVQYHTDCEAVTWATSTIRSWLNGYDANSNTGGESGTDYSKNNFKDSAFSAKEQTAIVDTNVGDEIIDKIFLLSYDESKSSVYFTSNDARRCVPTDYAIARGAINDSYAVEGKTIFWWWLRSVGSTSSIGGLVNYDSDAYGSIYYVDHAGNCVRPALNLNLESVIFTSAAVGGKKAATGTISKIADYTGNDWKVTLKDSSRNFDASVKSYSVTNKGGSVTVTYSGAQAGTNEYISAMLVDSNNNALYYGQLKNVTDNSAATGELTVDIPAGLADGYYTLKLFNEQCNGDYKTDYAGEPVDLAMLISDGDGTVSDKDGLGILKVKINSDNELIITYTDGTTVNLGVVVGKDGKDGITPHIGEDGYWYIGDTKTTVKAQGEKGADGTNGEDGKDGKDGNTPLLRINEDGIWEISYDNGETYTSLGVSATTGGTVKQATRTFFQKVADFFRNIFASIKRVFTR